MNRIVAVLVLLLLSATSAACATPEPRVGGRLLLRAGLFRTCSRFEPVSGRVGPAGGLLCQAGWYLAGPRLEPRVSWDRFDRERGRCGDLERRPAAPAGPAAVRIAAAIRREESWPATR